MTRCRWGFHHASMPLTLLTFVGVQSDGDGYPPFVLGNCFCGSTIVRALPGRCNDCNELAHEGGCDDVQAKMAVVA